LKRAGRIVSIEGILNSTTNVVLDLLAEGKTLDEAVGYARRRGFCESDPRADLDGSDAAHKLVLLAREAFGETLDVCWAKREGIAALDPAQVHAAALEGQVVRLVATCRRSNAGLELQLSVERLGPEHALARTRAEQNAVIIRSDDGSQTVLRGKGAGRWPTAQSVVGDLLELSRTRAGEALRRAPLLQTASVGGGLAQ
jgi:homoserine dehydrogenase